MILPGLKLCLAFGGTSAPASHSPIQPSFPMACSWLWIIVSLLQHLCPCGQVGWRNSIQLKNSLWKKLNKSVCFPACFTAFLGKKLCQHGTVRWGEKRETQGKIQQQGKILPGLVWPPKSCSACHSHSTLPVAYLIFILLSLIKVLCPFLYFSANNSLVYKSLSSTYH